MNILHSQPIRALVSLGWSNEKSEQLLAAPHYPSSPRTALPAVSARSPLHTQPGLKPLFGEQAPARTTPGYFILWTRSFELELGSERLTSLLEWGRRLVGETD